MDLLDFIFPPKCLECGKNGKYICLDCLSKVEKTSYISKNSYSLFRYHGVIRKAIVALKYKFAYKLSEELAIISSNELKKRKIFVKEFVLIPVPLHDKRKKWRGFNQSEVMGVKLANLMGFGYENDLVLKKINTDSQVGLKRIDRRKNLKGAFEINKSKLNKDKNYLIFDDVATTLSTIDEITKVFRRSGVSSVYSLTVAR